MDRELWLPFCYELDFLASSRHWKPKREWIREYVPVPIRELDPVDFPIAIQALGQEETCIGEAVPGPVHRLGSYLFRPAVDRTGAPLNRAAFEDAVSDRHDPSPVPDSGVPVPRPFHADDFPTPDMRSGATGNNALYCCTLDRAAIVHEWTQTKKFVRSTREAALGRANAFLHDAIVSVAGRVYVACPEPVWSVDGYRSERVRVRLEPQPSPTSPERVFSLDRLEDARAWARLLGGDDAPPDTVEILDPTAIERDDEWTLAQWVVDRFDGWSSLVEDDDRGDEEIGFERLVDRIRRESRGPHRYEVDQIMLGLADFLGRPRPEWHHIDPGLLCRMHAVADRWRLADASGRGLGTRRYLDDGDLDALYGL